MSLVEVRERERETVTDSRDVSERERERELRAGRVVGAHRFETPVVTYGPLSSVRCLDSRKVTVLATACSRVEAAHIHHEQSQLVASPSAFRGAPDPTATRNGATGVFLNILTS